MERHRCRKCRNPIRNAAAAHQGSGDDDWYHSDCWAETCESKQEAYEREVEAGGLTALLAPYVRRLAERVPTQCQDAYASVAQSRTA